MTFEEWLRIYERTYGVTLGDEEVHSAEQAWNNSAIVSRQAATEAERERCFQIAIGYKLHGDPLPGHRDDMVADAIACAIREADDD